MYCTNCGNQMGAADRFCSRCGQPPGGPQPPPACPAAGRLARDLSNKKIAGVCSGIARHLALDVTLVRVAFLAAIVFKGFGLLAYLIAWIAMPAEGPEARQAAPRAPQTV